VVGKTQSFCPRKAKRRGLSVEQSSNNGMFSDDAPGFKPAVATQRQHVASVSKCQCYGIENEGGAEDNHCPFFALQVRLVY
jgi:hypothetical protein